MIFIGLGVILWACGARGHAPPDQLGTYYYYFFDWKAEQHLRTMTREILKDIEYKMRYADFIFASYGGKISPEADQIYSEVGYLESSIMRKFRYMCAQYRMYTHIDEFMELKFTLDDMLNGNHLIQSAYHEILILRDLQNKALDRKEALHKKERALQYFMDFKMKEKTFKPKSRSKGSRAPARRQGGDGRRAGVDMKEGEKKLKQDLRKKKWSEGHGMNDSARWQEFSKDLEGIDFRK